MCSKPIPQHPGLALPASDANIQDYTRIVAWHLAAFLHLLMGLVNTYSARALERLAIHGTSCTTRSSANMCEL